MQIYFSLLLEKAFMQECNTSFDILHLSAYIIPSKPAL